MRYKTVTNRKVWHNALIALGLSMSLVGCSAEESVAEKYQKQQAALGEGSANADPAGTDGTTDDKTGTTDDKTGTTGDKTGTTGDKTGTTGDKTGTTGGDTGGTASPDAAAAAKGKTLLTANCAGCHPGLGPVLNKNNVAKVTAKLPTDKPVHGSVSAYFTGENLTNIQAYLKTVN